jgi:hypothetical protein
MLRYVGVERPSRIDWQELCPETNEGADPKARLSDDLIQKRRRLDESKRVLERMNAFQYRTARRGEVDDFLLLLARNATGLASRRLGTSGIEMVPVVQAKAGEPGVIWGFEAPVYGFTISSGYQIYVNFTLCTTERLVVMAAAHEVFHIQRAAPHVRGEDPRQHPCHLFAAALADRQGY